jgi:hypothetical protein
MRHIQSTLVTSLLALFVGTATPCLAENACNAARLVEVRSLAALPTAIRHLLPSATSGLDGIADRGGDFNVTDVVNHDLPMRRFTLAGVQTTCAVIAVEYGGIVHGFEVTEYKLTAAGWRSNWRRAVFSEPHSVADLLRAASSGAAP